MFLYDDYLPFDLGEVLIRSLSIKFKTKIRTAKPSEMIAE